MDPTRTRVTYGDPFVLNESENLLFRDKGVMPESYSHIATDAQAYGASVPMDIRHVSSVESDRATRREWSPAPDPIKVGLQKWCVVSVLIQKTNDDSSDAAMRKPCMALKVSGCFDDADKAATHAKKIQSLVPEFDVYVIAMYNWIALPIDDETLAMIERNFPDPRLQRIWDNYKEGLLQNDDRIISEHTEISSTSSASSHHVNAAPLPTE